MLVINLGTFNESILKHKFVLKQLPIMPAVAITCHKFQRKTAEEEIIMPNIHNMTTKWAYTAISRTTSARGTYTGCEIEGKAKRKLKIIST